jgi:hypothetical protein
MTAPLWDLSVFYPEHAAALVAEAVGGGRPRALCNLLERVIKTIESANPPGVCLLCDHVFGADLPAAYVLTSEHTDEPRQGCGNAVRNVCAEDRASLLHRVVEVYVRAVPGFAILGPVSTELGHA